MHSYSRIKFPLSLLKKTKRNFISKLVALVLFRDVLLFSQVFFNWVEPFPTGSKFTEQYLGVLNLSNQAVPLDQLWISNANSFFSLRTTDESSTLSNGIQQLQPYQQLWIFDRDHPGLDNLHRNDLISRAKVVSMGAVSFLKEKEEIALYQLSNLPDIYASNNEIDFSSFNSIKSQIKISFLDGISIPLEKPYPSLYFRSHKELIYYSNIFTAYLGKDIKKLRALNLRNQNSFSQKSILLSDSIIYPGQFVFIQFIASVENFSVLSPFAILNDEAPLSISQNEVFKLATKETGQIKLGYQEKIVTNIYVSPFEKHPQKGEINIDEIDLLLHSPQNKSGKSGQEYQPSGRKNVVICLECRPSSHQL